MLIRGARPLAARAGVIPSTVSARLPVVASTSARPFFSGLFGKKTNDSVPAPEPKAPILAQDNLFHHLSLSPFEDMRNKGKRMETYALCPVSYEKHHETKAVKYECPDCGFPTHATEERWVEGKEEHHAEACPRLREVNEDDHDMRSGRRLTEFENMPGMLPMCCCC
jgi:splicing suppressor protein 51